MVIVDQRDAVGIPVLKAKNDPPLVIDPDAVKTHQVTLQRFQTVTRRHAQVHKTMSGVQDIQFSECGSLDVAGKALDVVAVMPMVKIFRGLIAKADDHRLLLIIS